MATSTQKLSLLLSQIQNAAATDTGAQELEKQVKEAISALEAITKSTQHLLSIRSKASQRGFETDVLHFLQQYWLTEDKINRMSLLGQARSQACLLLEQVIANAKK